MPVLQNHRQPAPLDWFDAPAGRCLLDGEQQAIAGALVARPAQPPWLWLSALPAHPSEVSLPPRGVRLYRDGAVLGGDARCALPLPLGSESIGNIILQHVLDDGADELLDECERVLEPGGRIWLFTLNPWSPYRRHWARSGLGGRPDHAWQRRLGDLGLQPCAGGNSHLGPVWRHGGKARAPECLRAICLRQVEKRTAAAIPPAPAKAQWRPGTAPA